MRKYLFLVAVILLSGCGRKQPNNLVLPTQSSQYIQSEDHSETSVTEEIESSSIEGTMYSSDYYTEYSSIYETDVITTTETSFGKKDRWAGLQSKEDPTQSLEGQVYDETTQEVFSLETTEAQTSTAPLYTQPETTIANTQPAQKVEGWGNGDYSDMNSVELPSFYKTRGSVAYVDKTVVPDSNIFEKDAYGNYIIPMLFLRNAEQYNKALPYNSYGKIPYCYAYDSGGVVLNPLPKEYEEFKSLFMFGQSEDYNNRTINYTQPAFTD